MPPTFVINTRSRHPERDSLGVVRNKLAMALIGRTVEVLADARTIAHGIVRGVLLTDGAAPPKILVNGAKYDMDRVLTVVPASLN
jgi:hypothetical protein